MGIELLDSLEARKVESLKQSVNVFPSAPVGKVYEHLFYLCEVKLAGPAEPQDVVFIEHQQIHVNGACLLDPYDDLVHSLLLLG